MPKEVVPIRKQLRAKKRILRDKARKAEKRIKESELYSYDNMCKFENFISSLSKCIKGVSWKRSVQNYYMNCLTNMFKAYSAMECRKLIKMISDKEIIIYERGKARTITPIHIRDRMIQKVVCDYALVPVIEKKLIFDNGASLKGKGVLFSRNRLLKHLRKAIKEFGTNFYVICFDFKSYFDSIPHKTCRMMLERYFQDNDIVTLVMEIIKAPYRAKIMRIEDCVIIEKELNKLENDELCGICLGSQVSQIMALVIANDLDHYIKDVKGIKYYDRYMDDGRIFVKTKEEADTLIKEMKVIVRKLGLTFGPKKTFITKSTKGFTFLKVRYYVSSNGKVVRKLSRKGIVRMRRKLKKYKKKVDNGLMTLDDVYASMQSWLAHAKVANSYITVKHMLELYNNLFDGYMIKNKRETKRVLQANRRKEYSWSYFQQRLPKTAKTS